MIELIFLNASMILAMDYNAAKDDCEFLEKVCEKLAECEDKEEPKKVIKICTVVSNEKYECPKCGNYLTESDVFAGYCKWCGQKITMEGK